MTTKKERERLKMLRANAAKAREAKARKRVARLAAEKKEAAGTLIPLHMVPVPPGPSRKLPAKVKAQMAAKGVLRAKDIDRIVVDGLAQLTVAVFLEYQKRQGR